MMCRILQEHFLIPSQCFGCLQILRTGFFHADPHPGNLAVDADGSLIYYDFGMMGEIKAFTREKLLQMFYAVYEKDAKKIIQALIELGALVPTGDMGSVSKCSHPL